MFYATNALRAASWMEQADVCRQRGLYILAAECERIALSPSCKLPHTQPAIAGCV